MKIALVIEAFDPRRGGAEQWTWQLAQHLVRARHAVHVVAGRFSESAASMGVVCHATEPAASKTGFALAADHALAKLDVDVVHDMGSGWTCDVFQPHFGSRAALERGASPLTPWWLRPMKRLARGWLPRYQDYRRLTTAQYAAHDRLYVAVSNMVADDLTNDYGVPRAAIRVVPNGVDVNRFSFDQRKFYRAAMRARLGVDEGETLVLIVAHNARLKGVPALAAAVERLALAGRRVRLAVVGGKRRTISTAPVARAKVAASPRAADLSRFSLHADYTARPQPPPAPRVMWLGPVDDPRPYYAAADIYAQPTYYDACSLVVLEALACGLPVITTRRNGASERMTAECGRVLSNPSDVGALTSALGEMLSRDTRAAMSAAARDAALTGDLETNWRGIENVYAEIIERRQHLRRAA